MTQHDRIAIVGGGPVGLTAAYLLAQQGVPVTVIEREATPLVDYRASTFHAATLDVLEESGISDALVRMGIPCPIVQYRDWQAGKIAEFDHGVLAKDTRHPYRLQCEQYKLVQWLHAELTRTDGVELLYGHAVTALDQDEDRATLTLAGPDGSGTLAADWVIAADGGRSTVRKSLGIEFPGLTYPERILVVGTTTDFRSIFPEIANVNYVTDPVYYGHILRIPDLWRMSTPVYDGMSDEDAKRDEEVHRRLAHLMPGVAFPEIPVKAVYTVHQRVAGAYRKGRAFLAGDAAHLNNPKGGMGMNGGLHDALDLTGRLTRVWHGRADARTLDEYEAKRRPEAIDDIHRQTERNVKALKETDQDARQAQFDRWRKMEADPEATRAMLLETSMIASLRRAGMLR